jgi:hypothetical protein
MVKLPVCQIPPYDAPREGFAQLLASCHEEASSFSQGKPSSSRLQTRVFVGMQWRTDFVV